MDRKASPANYLCMRTSFRKCPRALIEGLRSKRAFKRNPYIPRKRRLKVKLMIFMILKSSYTFLAMGFAQMAFQGAVSLSINRYRS